MHERLQQRRERVLAESGSPASNPYLANLLCKLDTIESQISEFQSSIDDERLPGLAETVRSVRLLVEISTLNNLMSRDLLPAAGAALLHAREVLNLIRAKASANLLDEAPHSHH